MFSSLALFQRVDNWRQPKGPVDDPEDLAREPSGKRGNPENQRLYFAEERGQMKVVQKRGVRLLARALRMIAVVGLAMFVSAGPAAATWSIVGVDPETGEVGVAVASCADITELVASDAVLPLVAIAPGFGAGVSQADLNFDVAPEMARLLDGGASPDEVLAAVTDPEFDSDSDLRQHGVITVDGRAAAFTGTHINEVALDQQASNVTAQGNTLVSEAVITDALAAFNADDTMPLAERLVAALYAGSHQGGDARCGEQTALFASITVAGPTDDPAAPSTLVTVTAEEGANNPVAELAEQFGVEVDGGGFPIAAVVIPIVVLAVVGIGLGLRRRKLRVAGLRRP